MCIASQVGHTSSLPAASMGPSQEQRANEEEMRQMNLAVSEGAIEVLYERPVEIFPLCVIENSRTFC